MKQKIIAAFLAAAMLAPAAVRAEEWIELSSWSYNEVSGFISDGLMPELLKGKGNYKQPITRGEFAELIYSVMDNTGMIIRTKNSEPFIDCDGYTGAQMLGSIGITDGVSDVNEQFKAYFAPEENITREDAAVMLSRAVQKSFKSESAYAEYDFFKIIERYDDIDELSTYAINPVRYMFQYKIMEGDDENRRFDPKGNLSIEQAVLMVYRYYKAIPRVIESDNEGAAEGDVIKRFDGGMTEVYENNTYYIKDENGAVLMSFEADVYSSLLCCEFGGERLCFAVNFNDNTDVYNLDTQAYKYTISEIVYELNAEKGYAYTYSWRFMPVYSGMWNMKGYLSIPASYSRSEVDELIALAEETGIEAYPEPKETPGSEPDGMLYYCDTENGGRLCSIDSNGENKRVLVDEECRNISYINGMLYFVADDDGVPQFYCVNPDGGEKELLCRADAGSLCDPMSFRFHDDCSEDEIEMNRQRNQGGVMSSYFGDAANYGALNNGVLLYGGLNDNGDPRGLCEIRLTENGVEKISIAGFPVHRSSISAPYDGSGRIFFADDNKLHDNGSSPLYMYDGTETRIVSGDYNVISYGFKYDSDGTIQKDKVYFTADELGAGACAYVDLVTGEINVYTPEDEKEELSTEEPQYKSDNYFTAYNKNGLEVETGLNFIALCHAMRVKYNGQTTEINRAYFKKVIGDYIYYIEAGRLVSSQDLTYGGYSVRQTGKVPLYAYNYRTGETVMIDDDYFSDAVGVPDQYADGFGVYFENGTYDDEYYNDDIFIYCSNAGVYKRVCGERAVAVYPNKGMHKYGSVYAVGEIAASTRDDGCVYKVDKNGNMSYITDTKVEYWLYVPNGAKMPQFTYSRYMK